MQFAVPQFVDVEPKIFFFISVRQFVLICIGLTAIFFLYRKADFGMFLFFSVIIAIVVAVFAFVKVNGRPFHYFVLNIFETLKNPHLRVWKKDVLSTASKKSQKKSPSDKAAVNYIKVAREKQKASSRISELSLLVDTGGYYEKS
jgi:hypothetical protein